MKRKVTTIKSGTCIYIKVVHDLIRSYRRVCCVEPSSPINSLKMHLLFEVKMPWRYEFFVSNITCSRTPDRDFRCFQTFIQCFEYAECKIGI